MKLEGFKEVPMEKLISVIDQKVSDSGKNKIDLANELNLKSTDHLRACMKTPGKVSESLITRFFDTINLIGIVVTHKGEKHFFIKNN